ncbi:MAG TPA: Asp-tRNA(Asn)/Glu-tRNA(Gln) amidotransferase subunit GatC [Candidatus Limnocylindrales bacterium]|nr:Asp-tRNA(Asn)/Glu-tRNA(Gln) amidotransferase subunit GatC [Candidatus Limnocylindrales bacterium]
MKLSREEVQRVAVLARLRLTPEEQSSLTDELDRILGYMDKLNQLDTADVDLFSHAANITNTLREDRVTNRSNADALLANAPDRDGTFFKVPKIIE